MKSWTASMAMVLLGAAAIAPAWAADGASSGGGKAVFTDQKCNKCHRVSTEGIVPLKEKEGIAEVSGVGANHDAAWFKKWLLKEVDMDSKLKPGEKVKHKSAWKGTDAELDSVTAWLKTLTKKAK